MYFIIHCLDYPGKVEQRLKYYQDHKTYLSSASSVKSVISGPLVAEDHETMIGSCFIVEAKNLEDVQDFHTNDPFYKAGIWEKVNIHPFLKRIDNRCSK